MIRRVRTYLSFAFGSSPAAGTARCLFAGFLLRLVEVAGRTRANVLGWSIARRAGGFEHSFEIIDGLRAGSQESFFEQGLVSGAPCASLTIKRDPVISRAAGLKLEHAVKSILNIRWTRPCRFVVNESAAADDPRHIRKQAISVMGCALEIVEQDLTLDVAMLAKHIRVPPFVIHGSMMAIILSGMRFACVNEHRAHGPIRMPAGDLLHRAGRHRAVWSREGTELHDHDIRFPEIFHF